MQEKIKRETVDGLEIYARKIDNNGVFSSDTYTKIVTDDYKGNGIISNFSKSGFNLASWHTTWWGVLLSSVVAGLVIAGLVYLFGWYK